MNGLPENRMAFFRTDPRATAIGRALIGRAVDLFGEHGVSEDSIALTLLLHEAPLCGQPEATAPAGFSHQGSRPFYPCSVVKLFYLVAAQARLEEGYLSEHGELDRAMLDMIRVSSNTGTNYVIDLVTGTTGDTLLPAEEMAAWREKRGWVNRYFDSYGWPEFGPINVCQKLMDDERYGREKMFVGADGHNHNALTTEATARLFQAVMTGTVVTPERCRLIAGHLRRSLDENVVANTPAYQVLNYFGQGLPEGAKLWSKAGWTGWTGDPTASYRRHDAAHVLLPGGQAFTLVAFSQGRAINLNGEFLPSIAAHAAELIVAV
jgi:beta-lactamase class A